LRIAEATWIKADFPQDLTMIAAIADEAAKAVS
jgi:hypothetical protein